MMSIDVFYDEPVGFFLPSDHSNAIEHIVTNRFINTIININTNNIKLKKARIIIINTIKTNIRTTIKNKTTNIIKFTNKNTFKRQKQKYPLNVVDNEPNRNSF